MLRTGDAEDGLLGEGRPLPERRLRRLGGVEEDPSGPAEEHRPHEELEHGPGQGRQQSGRTLSIGSIAGAAALEERLPFLDHGAGKRVKQ